MPIECNFYEGGKIYKGGQPERQAPIEAGMFHTYRYTADNIGYVVLAACAIEDTAGRVYLFEQEQWDTIEEESMSPDRRIDDEAFNDHDFEEIISGGTYYVSFKVESGLDNTISFYHVAVH